MTTEQQAGKLKVFVSYSRADAKFADELVAGLEFDGGFEITIDCHSIEKGEDWRARLGALIEAADTIVFVLSPTSATSEICRWEVECASGFNKRILPVLHLPLEGVAPPPALGKINYVDFTVSPTLIAGIRDLATALRTDIGWLREAMRLLNLAIDWQRADHRDNRLLSGPDIVEAKRWLADCPPIEKPTELHRNYIRASEAAEVARLDVERTRLADLAEAQGEAATQARRVARRTSAGLAVAIVLAIAAASAGWLAWGQAQRAMMSERVADTASRDAQMTQSGLLSVAAKNISDQPGGGDAPVAMLLALEGMPDTENQDRRQKTRPLLAVTQFELDRAWRNTREQHFIAHDQLVSAVSWSPDGKFLATGSGPFGTSGEARIVEKATGREVVRVRHNGGVRVLAWRPDGHILATGADDGVRILEATTGKILGSDAQDDGVSALAWSPDGKWLATGSGRGTAQIVEVASGKVVELARMSGLTPVGGPPALPGRQ